MSVGLRGNPGKKHLEWVSVPHRIWGTPNARQLSRELVRSRTVFTSITAGTQALFDALKAFLDRHKQTLPKRAVMVVDQASPSTGEVQR